MNYRLSLISPILTVLIGFVSALPAQGREGNAGGREVGNLPDVQAELTEQRRGKASAKQAQEDQVAKWEAMSPEERLDAGRRRGSKAHCRFVASCRPPKLMPGQSGTLMITAILQGSSVLPAPLAVKMTPRIRAEVATLGELRAHPAKLGSLASFYKGRPVYENTAVFEVPVTMGTAAKIGDKQLVAVDLQFDIFDGGSGQAVGRFIERVSSSIEVGQYIDPAVIGRPAKQEPEVESVEPVAPSVPDAAAASAPQPAGSGDVLSGSVDAMPVERAASSQEPEVSDAGDVPPVVGEEAGPPSMLLIGGGALLLAIVLLLLRKK